MPSAEIVALIPVLNRPANARKVAHSITATSNARPVFICSQGDIQQQRACARTKHETLTVPWTPGPADWARKLEYGRRHTSEPYMLLAADDLLFHPGWEQVALDKFAQADIGVLGTQDGGNPTVLRGLHSTHPIVCRGYADEHGTVDNPDIMIHDGYQHAYCDNELVETAISRGCWLFARDCYIEHLHPAWNKAKWDQTYALGNSSLVADHRLFLRRRPLWRRRGRRHLLTAGAPA